MPGAHSPLAVVHSLCGLALYLEFCVRLYLKNVFKEMVNINYKTHEPLTLISLGSLAKAMVTQQILLCNVAVFVSVFMFVLEFHLAC